jgi:hypothetical protein
MRMRLTCLGLLAGLPLLADSPYAGWKQGPPADPSFFPIAVWLQPPSKAERFKEIGINTYVGLWRGPTEEQLAAVRKAGLRLICHQNEVALRHLQDPTIIGWMHGDEPDNAQSLGEGKGYGPPIPPEMITRDYQRLRQADPSRPVLLNLGQGVAWDNWYGRGVRTRHPEDYPAYVQGCDIVSFDIYPVVHSHPEVAGHLDYVARGVQRLVQWTKGEKVVWNCIECTRISHPAAKATPRQVQCEVWMSLIHGSRGLIYFVHEWKPRFNESALLDDAELRPAVAEINRQITRLAPVLNSPTLPGAAQVTVDNNEVPVAVMVKRHQEALYLFAVAMRAGVTAGTFRLGALTGSHTVEVLGEDRTLSARDGVFTDRFQSWDTHLYRVAPAP